jgi:hypothetical protein
MAEIAQRDRTGTDREVARRAKSAMWRMTAHVGRTSLVTPPPPRGTAGCDPVWTVVAAVMEVLNDLRDDARRDVERTLGAGA